MLAVMVRFANGLQTNGAGRTGFGDTEQQGAGPVFAY
jgi:hypothetical protein